VIGIPALGVPELGVALSATMMDSIVKDNTAALDKLVTPRRGKASIGEVMLVNERASRTEAEIREGRLHI